VLVLSSTLNSALGSVSTTTAITSIASSSTNALLRVAGTLVRSPNALLSCACAHSIFEYTRMGRNPSESAPAARLCDRDRVLEVGAEAAVDGQGGPAVGQHLHLSPPALIIGSMASTIPASAAALAARLRSLDLRVFVHGFTDSVADTTRERRRSPRPRTSPALLRRCRPGGHRPVPAGSPAPARPGNVEQLFGAALGVPTA